MESLTGNYQPCNVGLPTGFRQELSDITAEVQRGLTENVTKQRKVLLKSLKGVAKPSMGLSYSQQLVVEDWL